MRENLVTQSSKWANRFMVAAIVQGALAAGLTSYLLYEGVFGSPAASRIVANLGGAGNAGVWLTVGYLVYLPLGPIAAAVTALFYRHIETHLQKPYKGWTNLLAWVHLIFMNVGVVGATWLMMNAGYRGGVAALPTSQGGLGWTALQIHTNIMEGYPMYIAPFVAFALIGAIFGGLGYVAAWRRTVKTPLVQQRLNSTSALENPRRRGTSVLLGAILVSDKLIGF